MEKEASVIEQILSETFSELEKEKDISLELVAALKKHSAEKGLTNPRDIISILNSK